MIDWPRYSVYNSPDYLKLREEIINPGPGTPKAWAYPWCILNGQLKKYLFSIDLGSGSWTNFTQYINLITNSLTVGVDISNLQKDIRDVRFVQGDIGKLEFPSNFFDRIFSVSVLEHVPISSRSQVCDELFRVLRPGGLAVITIDWIFGMNNQLLSQLSVSEYLGRTGSQIYGNYNFSKLISDYAHITSPLKPIDEIYLPGSPKFDEERILADKDRLVSESTDITDVDLFKYTTVGLIMQKHGEPQDEY
ncbi:MAG: class I SAM-dependent methyltransferase [Candidatus Scalinduaceae bacterium]